MHKNMIKALVSQAVNTRKGSCHLYKVGEYHLYTHGFKLTQSGAELMVLWITCNKYIDLRHNKYINNAPWFKYQFSFGELTVSLEIPTFSKVA